MVCEKFPAVKSPCELSSVGLFATPWTVYVGFPRQEYWSRLPFPPPGDLLNPRTEPVSVTPLALASRFFATSATWEAQYAVGVR